MCFLNLDLNENIEEVLISIGMLFHIVGPQCEKDVFPKFEVTAGMNKFEGILCLVLWECIFDSVDRVWGIVWLLNSFTISLAMDSL